jgi:hypothetical protein
MGLVGGVVEAMPFGDSTSTSSGCAMSWYTSSHSSKRCASAGACCAPAHRCWCSRFGTGSGCSPTGCGQAGGRRCEAVASGRMFGSRRRRVVGCVALVVLLGALPRAGELRGVVTLEGGSERSSAVLADSAPAGVVVSAVRFRASLTSELVFEVRWAKAGAGGLASSVALGVGMAAVAWWWLRRRDEGAAVRLPCRTPTRLRAPPLTAFA